MEELARTYSRARVIKSIRKNVQRNYDSLSNLEKNMYIYMERINFWENAPNTVLMELGKGLESRGELLDE